MRRGAAERDEGEQHQVEEKRSSSSDVGRSSGGAAREELENEHPWPSRRIRHHRPRFGRPRELVMVVDGWVCWAWWCGALETMVVG